ncbi:hypothetical protein J7K93_07195 [bacterium]|nr:hypothetical protein [bacterium]
MKKLTLILVVIALSITIFACSGGNSQQKNKAAAKKTTQKAEIKNTDVKKELIVSLTIGGEELKLKEAGIRNNAITPGQKSNDYTIDAITAGEGQNTDEVAFSLDFTAAGPGEATHPYMTLKTYKINNVSVQIEKIETKKGTYGGTRVTSIKGSFNGQLKKRGENGFPTGDLMNFSGTFEK